MVEGREVRWERVPGQGLMGSQWAHRSESTKTAARGYATPPSNRFYISELVEESMAFILVQISQADGLPARSCVLSVATVQEVGFRRVYNASFKG